MANEYMNSNVLGAGLTVPAKVRKAATDKSSITSDYKSQTAPGQAPVDKVRSGAGTAKGPATVIQGVYTQPSGGGRKI
jgi:hypothetical protein